MRHVALEGRCFVLSANQFIRRASYPQGYATSFGDNPDTIVSPGGSCIVGPLGQMLVEPNFEGPGILIADLDLRECVRGKFDFDVVGHYARPDIFKLTVNEMPARSVTFSNTGHPPSFEGAQNAET
jgi:nitrilase